jgi:alkyl sulfatase BDS1-like metallo-beta-lactamase superfamily hydrolase
MNTLSKNMHYQGGAIGKILLLVIAVVVVAGTWMMLDEDAGRDIKKQAQLKTMEMIGDAAANRLGGSGEESGETHGSAVDLIKRPIEVRKVTDNVYYATGVGNTIMVTTSEGNVLLDTGLSIQAAKQLRLLKEQVSDAPVTHIVLSHSHADHSGGAKLWQEEGTEIVTHKDFTEEQRYLTELQPYLWQRNRRLFPWMPAEPTDIAMLAYGGIEPTISVDDEDVFRFSMGGVDFEVIGAPGAEGADNVVLWLPQQKVLIAGDFFGPQFPQFPNVFTMRGEKVRKPMEYVASLDKLMALEPEIIIPSHLNPTVGKEVIREGMQRTRDAVQYVHDETIAGMNAGKSVYDLMKEIQLPPHLELPQNHGKVDWAVKSIWEYYATWFHFDSTTELYPVPARDVYADLAEAAGAEALLSLSRNYLNQGEPVKALHVIEVTLASQPTNKDALGQRREALEVLMQRAEAGMRNDYEIYWLKTRMADTDSRLEVAP